MCKCVSLVNKKLAEHNTEICLIGTINPKNGRYEERMIVPTIKLNNRKRGNAMKVFASYCPMCGEKYPEIEKIEK